MRDDKRLPEQDETRDAIDSRIEAALRSYAEPPEPTDPRIAVARVMDRARAEGPRPTARWWMWGIAAGAACLLAVAFVLGLFRASQAPRIAWTPKAPGVATLPVHSARAASPAMPPIAHARRANSPREMARLQKPLPKLDVFPTPTPLSPQEQALVEFAKQGPAGVQRAVLADQKRWDDATAMAGLQMPPEAAHQQDQ